MSNIFLIFALCFSSTTVLADQSKDGIDNPLEKARQIKVKSGYKVIDIERGSLYEKLGLRSGDKITKVDGKKIKNTDQLISSIASAKEITIQRNNKEQTIAVSHPKDKFISSGESIGTFESFSWGHFAYIQIKSKGKELSFRAERGPTSVFEQYQKELKGTEIKIYWEKILTFIPQAGEQVEIIRTKDICSMTPIKYQSKPYKAVVKTCK